MNKLIGEQPNLMQNENLFKEQNAQIENGGKKENEQMQQNLNELNQINLELSENAVLEQPARESENEIKNAKNLLENENLFANVFNKNQNNQIGNEKTCENENKEEGNEKACDNKIESEDLNVMQNGSPYGKFKTANDLLNAYNNLQAEFTRRCQTLKKMQNQIEMLELDKDEQIAENENIGKNENKVKTNLQESLNQNLNLKGQTAGEENENNAKIASIEESEIKEKAKSEEAHDNNKMYDTADNDNVPSYQKPDFDEQLAKFLSVNENAKLYAKEIGEEILLDRTLTLQSAYDRVLAKKYKTPKELASDDNFITNYILNNEKVLKSIIKDVKSKQEELPKIISNQKGTMAQALPSAVSTLKEAGELAYRLFD